MGERGRCSNCKREGVSLVPGMKVCWNCQKHAQGSTGEERSKKLAEAAALYKETPIKILKDKRMKQQAIKESMQKAAPPPPPPPPPMRVIREGIEIQNRPPETLSQPIVGEIVAFSPGDDRFNVIRIDFSPEDQDLLLHVKSLAKKNRRTPDQQILYMIDCIRQADLEAGQGPTGY